MRSFTVIGYKWLLWYLCIPCPVLAISVDELSKWQYPKIYIQLIAILDFLYRGRCCVGWEDSALPWQHSFFLYLYLFHFLALSPLTLFSPSSLSLLPHIISPFSSKFVFQFKYILLHNTPWRLLLWGCRLTQPWKPFRSKRWFLPFVDGCRTCREIQGGSSTLSANGTYNQPTRPPNPKPTHELVTILSLYQKQPSWTITARSVWSSKPELIQCFCYFNVSLKQCGFRNVNEAPTLLRALIDNIIK